MAALDDFSSQRRLMGDPLGLRELLLGHFRYLNTVAASCLVWMSSGGSHVTAGEQLGIPSCPWSKNCPPIRTCR